MWKSLVEYLAWNPHGRGTWADKFQLLFVEYLQYVVVIHNATRSHLPKIFLAFVDNLRGDLFSTCQVCPKVTI